jgi:hypothetical protein
MTALLDHLTIKRLGAQTIAPVGVCEVIESAGSQPAQTRLACRWHKDPAGRLACTWRLSSRYESAPLA